MSSPRIILIITLAAFFFNSPANSNQKLTSINKIQGSNNESPMLGQSVTTQGIVTANFQSEKGFSGFFIQRKNHSIQSQSSSAIFVYERKIKVKVGDLIQISGEVSEHNGMTQLSKVHSIDILKSRQKLPKAIAISLPLKNFNLERLEAMRVTLSKPALISDNYNYIKYGEFTVSSQVLSNPSNKVKPGMAIKKVKQQNINDRLLIDDGRFSQFPNYNKLDNKIPFHIGAKVQVHGVLHYAFDRYRIEITKDVEFLDSPFSKQQKPTQVAGDVKIASFNIKNYFTTIDNGKEICGPKQNFSCRGADSKAEFKRQQAKLVTAINTAQADIYAIQELENNEQSLPNLVKALNTNPKNITWKYIKTGALGEDVIRVGLIYKADKITAVDSYKLLNSKVMPEFEADKNREVLLQTFKDSGNNQFNIAVLHLKSKRCSDAVGADKDQNDGQGCYNASRVKVAQQISDWLNQDPTYQKAKPTIVIGDFNSYTKEDPITTFAKNGYTNLASKYLTTPHWTSIFRGEVGSIDHILTNKAASNAAQDMTQWHINSVIPSWFDYNLENLAKSKAKPKSYYNQSPFASSDHDMIIAGFTFKE